MSDIIIPLEIAGLNRMAQEASDKIELLCKALVHDKAGWVELDRFLTSQREQCRRYFQDARE
jgi:hypothetical protein